MVHELNFKKLLPKKIRNKEERNVQILRSSFHSLEPGGCHDSTLVNDYSFVLTENKTEGSNFSHLSPLVNLCFLL